MTTVSVRRRRPGYHRAAGRTLVVAGALVAESAPVVRLMDPQEGTGDVLYLLRLAFNLAVAEWAVRRRPAPRRRPRPAVVGAQP